MTGVLDGTPTVAAGVNVTVRATDSNGCFGEVIVTLQINCPTITISPSSGSPTVLTSGTVGQSYSQTFTAAPAGGGYSYSIPGPAIPPGLMFNTATGVLSGTPTTQGTFFFTVTATGFGTCAGTQDYSLTINAGCPSSFTVNDLGDAPDQTPGDFLCQAASGACTLRAAIMEANAIPACTPLTINFSVTGTINLATALPALNHPNLTINGPGANQLDVHRNAVAAFRIFTINGGRTVAISGLSVTNGNDPVQAGGIYNAGTLTLTACAISGNTSPQGGGIQSDNILTMTGCTVNNNIASDFAGGLKIFGPTTTLTNCTFSNNQANDSSAIESGTGATLTLTNCTIANNQAGSGAGQTGSALFANSGTVLKNTIVANNSGNNANIAGPVDTANSFNNLIGAVGTGGLTNGVNGNQVGVANANTLLAALGNYGGTTQTIALLPGSPAINAGTASGAPATDQRGIARPQLGTVDIGAFESRGFTLALAGGNNQSAFVNTAFANPLAVSVTANSAGEPVNGGKVTFTPPGSGASATIAGNPVTIAGGVANGNATANGVVGGPYTVAASANGATPAINFSLTNTNPPPTIVAGAALTRQQGSAASNSPIATVSDPNQTAGTLTVTATTVPAGLTVMNIVNTNGTITADVAASCLATLGANTIVLTVTDSFGATATANLTVNVTANTAPSLVYATPQNVTAGNSLNVSPTTATDNGSITGYSIVSVTPALSTAPTVNASGMVAITNAGPSGSHVITVRATDNCNATTDASFTLNVNCQTITVTAPATNTGTISTAFSQTFTQSGGIGTITWSETGALPAGITLNSSTGVLSGTPTATGTFPITVKATDTNGCMGTVNYTLTISCPIFTINPPTLPNATVGTHYIETISAVAANGITLTGGNLPPGMQLILFQPGQSVLTGTPTAPGTFTFTVTATGFGGCTGQRDFTLVVQGGAAPPLTARIDDPLVCTGPGNTVSVTATVTNTNGTAQPASFTATLTPTLRALPGTCTANVGTCSVVNASTVTWVGTLAANQTVTINYQAQVNDGVLPGTQLCATSVATVGSSLPATVTACSVVNCPVIGPGALPAATSPISDQKAGSVLIFNVYTSSTNPIQQNTRVSITNINPTLPAFVHLFLVDGASCSVADSILCLTANQTTTFLASDLDPGTTGYIIAVAVDGNGCPTNFNYLIGDEYVKFSTGHAANLGAEAITAIAGGLPLCDTNSTTATLAFDGISYNLVPHVLAADNIGSRADGNDTLLILNRIGGNLATGASTLGTIFGLFYDDSERGVSFNLAAGACQFRNSITNTLPRITPRFDQFVPAGRTGWFKVWVPGLFGMTGAILNTNPNAGTSAGAFDQGHNLHKLTLTSTASYTIPIFPPGC
jgi:CSLREA domain-containing protein